MFKTTLIAAGALIAATAVTVPANAGSTGFSFGISGPSGAIYFGSPGYQSRSYGYSRHRQILPPRAVTHRLHHQGFRNIRSLERRGNVYVARAQQRRGQRVLVTVNAYTGHVASVRRIW